MKQLLKYNIFMFVICISFFAALTVRDLRAVGFNGHPDEILILRVSENFYWCRVLFGCSMFPFFWLLHPSINKLLTHSTPTGFTRLGTLRRYKPEMMQRRIYELPSLKLPGMSDGAESDGTSSEDELPEQPRTPHRLRDPVENLQHVIRLFPGGGIALWAARMSYRSTTLTAGAVVSLVALEIRAASAAVSLGLRVADASVSTTSFIVQSVPGSGLALRAGGAAASGRAPWLEESPGCRQGSFDASPVEASC